MLAAGGDRASDLDILRSSPGAFGHMPSSVTVSRFFERTVTNLELFGYGFEAFHPATAHPGLGRRRGPEPGTCPRRPRILIIDLDATLVTSHSDKETSPEPTKAPTLALFIASLDYGAVRGSGEILAAVLRPGNAGANSAEDHIRVFRTAVAQLPEGFFDETGTLAVEKELVRTDSAGVLRKFLWHLHGLGVQLSTS